MLDGGSLLVQWLQLFSSSLSDRIVARSKEDQSSNIHGGIIHRLYAQMCDLYQLLYPVQFQRLAATGSSSAGEKTASRISSLDSDYQSIAIFKAAGWYLSSLLACLVGEFSRTARTRQAFNTPFVTPQSICSTRWCSPWNSLTFARRFSTCFRLPPWLHSTMISQGQAGWDLAGEDGNQLILEG
jgi:hypothetical protein